MGKGTHGGVRRSAVVVGREDELERLSRAVHDVAAGASRSLFLIGEGGVGKTRLLGEVGALARQLGVAVMAGRAPVTTPVAFSVVSEALRSWVRAQPVTAPMPPFDPGLRLMMPEWPVDTDAASGLTDAQLRLLALEGVVRLVQHVAATCGGAVLLFDDLHAADADSLEAIRYLAASRSERVLLVGALRGREVPQVEEMVRALQREEAAEGLDLAPLDRRAVTALLGALLDAVPPSELVDDVVTRTDGVPLLVEEALDAHLRAGSLALDDRGAAWRGGGAVVTRTVRDMVEGRLTRLTTSQRAVITGGAVLGEFDVELLAVVVAQPAADVGDAIAAAIDNGLLESVGGAVTFRHAIIRDAVLDGTLPHELRALHRHAADALAGVRPADATTLERRARHLGTIGEDDDASVLLTDAASARLDAHTLLSAESLARQAGEWAREPSTRAASSDVLARVLAAQGRFVEALALDESADRAHGEQPARRRRMAACAVEAARPDLAAPLIEQALASGDDSPHVQVLAGRVALANNDAATAMEWAERALASTDERDPNARCAALDLSGRALDYSGRRDEARAAWTEQAELAARAGLTDQRLRAVVLLGKVDLFDGAGTERLFEARDLARDAGAFIEQAWAEENLAIALAVGGDPAAAMEVLDEAVARCRELRLDQLAYLVSAQAMTSSFQGVEWPEAAFAEAERLDPSVDVRLHTLSMRADIAARRGRYDDAIVYLEECVEMLRSRSGAPNDAACWLVWAYAAAGRTDDAAHALADAGTTPDDFARWYGRPAVMAAATAMLARDVDALEAAFAATPARMPFDLALMRMLAAEIVGGPYAAEWLRAALATYEAAGAELECARVRRMLRDAGAPVPRKRRAAGSVPPELAELGVTAREADVLRLLGDGLSNAAIAQRLYISVRTVETHVSSLLAKLQVESRGQLTARSLTIAFDPKEKSPA